MGGEGRGWEERGRGKTEHRREQRRFTNRTIISVSRLKPPRLLLLSPRDTISYIMLIDAGIYQTRNGLELDDDDLDPEMGMYDLSDKIHVVYFMYDPSVDDEMRI